MKPLKIVLIMAFLFTLATATVTHARTVKMAGVEQMVYTVDPPGADFHLANIEHTVEAAEQPDVGVIPFLKANWAELLISLLAFAKVVVRLTPTIKDDKVFGWIDDLIAFFIPNIQNKKT